MVVRYRINYAKAIETVLWLVGQKPNLDIYHIGKAIFYAEKCHLNKYARPIIGDSYQKGSFGPCPSTIRDIIHQKSKWLSPDELQQATDALEIINTPYPTPIPKRPPELDAFSGTDIECLKEALDFVGEMSFNQLKEMSHEEESFLNAIEDDNLDYELLIDENNPIKNEVINEMRETNRYVCV